MSSISNLAVFYVIFAPLTIYSVYFLLSLFYPVILNGNILIIEKINMVLIRACIAGSAYFLLFILNLSVPMKLKKRIYSLAFSFFIFLAINIIRIFIFSLLLIDNFRYFDITHKIFWFALSGIIVFLVWILTIRVFKIKDIPFYTDIKYLYKLAKKKK